MKRHECDDFLRGYLDAALFTTDTNPPSGCDYVESGRAEEMFPNLPDEFVEQARKDCEAFRKTPAWLALCEALGNEELGDLESDLGDPDGHAGRDFWYTRNGHGCGFWDGDWPEPHADALTEAAKVFGECYLMPEDIGQTARA